MKVVRIALNRTKVSTVKDLHINDTIILVKNLLMLEVVAVCYSDVRLSPIESIVLEG